MNNIELQKLVRFCWKLAEEDKVDGNNMPDLDKCQDELNELADVCIEYVLLKAKNR